MRLARAGEDAVEQEFEGRVRLAALRDFAAQQIDAAATDRSVDNAGVAVQQVLAPRPPRYQRVVVIIAGDLMDVRTGRQAENGIVVVEHVDGFGDAVGKQVGNIDLNRDD